MGLKKHNMWKKGKHDREIMTVRNKAVGLLQALKLEFSP
jgi:hypothetical protein